MTTLHTTSRHPRPDHEALVERTLALLPQRRDGGGETAHAPPPDHQADSVDRFIPPASQAAYQSLLDRIDHLREGALIGSDARAQIMHDADALGIRPFEASMMIALAQDRARRGESNTNIPRLLQARSTPHRESAATTAGHWPDALTWIGVAATGLLITGFIAQWFTG